MSPEQEEKLRSIETQLVEVFVAEAMIAQWPGKGAKVADLSQQERGDLYWTKKNAAMTLTLAGQIDAFIMNKAARVARVEHERRGGTGAPIEEPAVVDYDTERETARFEKLAAAALAKANRG